MSSIFFAFEGNAIQLVPDGTIILHMIIIVLMVVLLNVTLFKPINRILEERDARTRGALEDAGAMFARVDAMMREYEQSLRRARTEGYSLLERQRGEAVRERERKIAEAREVLSKQAGAQKQEIERQAEAARIQLSEEARRIADVISSQLLGRSGRF